MCITGGDENIHGFKVNGCRIQDSSNGNVSITPTVVEQVTTTPKSSESNLSNESEKTTQTPESRLISSNVNVLITPTVVEQVTTTPKTSESDLSKESEKTTQTPESRLNMTTEVTEYTEQKKSRHSLHIILPLVISFLVVCSGCAVWLWLYRRMKCVLWLSQKNYRRFS